MPASFYLRGEHESEIVVENGLVVGNAVHEFTNFQVLRMVDIALQSVQILKNGVDADVEDIALIDVGTNYSGLDLRDDGSEILGLLAESFDGSHTILGSAVLVDFPENNVLDHDDLPPED